MPITSTTTRRRLAVAGLGALACAGTIAPAVEAHVDADLVVGRARAHARLAPSIWLGARLDRRALLTPVLEDVGSLGNGVVSSADTEVQPVIATAASTIDAVTDVVTSVEPSADADVEVSAPAVVNATVDASVHAATQASLDAAVAAQATAHEAGDIAAEVQAIAEVQVAAAAEIVTDATLRLRTTVAETVARASATTALAARVVGGVRIDPVSIEVAAALRGLGITAFAVIDHNGDVVRGPGALRVMTYVAGADVRWNAGMDGCAQVAISNTLIPRMLTVDARSALRTFVVDLDAIAGVDAGTLRDVTIAALC